MVIIYYGCGGSGIKIKETSTEIKASLKDTCNRKLEAKDLDSVYICTGHVAYSYHKNNK